MAIESVLRGRTFQLFGGHPALDLVNTLDWRFRQGQQEELLKTYSDLMGFAGQSLLIDPKEMRRLLRGGSDDSRNKALSAVRDLREALANVLYAAVDTRPPASHAFETLEKSFKKAHALQKLQWNATGASWIWSGDDLPSEMPLWRLALSAEELITSEQLALVRACAKPDCRWLFLDTSKNHTRRWCNMQLCGNRMKARRFKAQRRAEI